SATAAARARVVQPAPFCRRSAHPFLWRVWSRTYTRESQQNRVCEEFAFLSLPARAARSARSLLLPSAAGATRVWFPGPTFLLHPGLSPPFYRLTAATTKP